MAYAAAVCLILAAIIVSASRLLTPLVDKHRADFEKIASQLLDAPVVIEKVHFSWYGYQPTIGFDQVTILDKVTKEPELQIRKVSLFFSIPRSLWQRTLAASGIMISGSEVNAHQSATGEISLQGFPNLGGFNSQPYNNETKFKDMLAWLSSQSRLILQDIDVSYTAKTGEKHFITLHNLSFENSGIEHNILGKAILHQKIPTEVTVAVQWKGANPDLEQIKAKIYLYVTGLTLPQWIKGLSWKGWHIRDGVASAKVWATWNNGHFRKIQTTFQTFGLNVYSETSKAAYKINRLSGNVGWKQDKDGQIIAGDDILVDLPQHLWPVTSFYVALAAGSGGQLYPKVATLGYVDLHDIQVFLPAFPALLPEPLKQVIRDLKLKGSLQNATMTFANPWTDWNQTSLNANFRQISFAPRQSFPGADNISGAIQWNGKKGNLTLNTERARLHYDDAFANVINMDQLTGEIAIQRNQNDVWIMQTSSLQLLNNDLAANISGRLTVPADKSPPVADLNANMTMQKATSITRYLPVRIMDKTLKDWLSQAFLSGEIKSANAVLRGKLKDFPFDQNNGSFSITAVVKNVDFRYAPNWPMMKRVNANLAYAQRKMTIDVDNALIFGIPVTQVHGVIPYLGENKPQILEVQADNIQMDFVNGLNFIHASPLEKTIGKMFNGLDLRGPVTLKLGLTVPLSEPDKTQVKGVVTLKAAEMKLQPWDLVISNLKGQLAFTETGMDAKEIQGTLFNKPLTLSLTTVQQTKDTSFVQAGFTTHLGMENLEKWLKIPFSSYAEGWAEVRGEIDLSLDTPIEVRLKSNLVGLTLSHLPQEYNKTAAETREFSAQIIAQEKKPLRLRLEYASLLGAALVLDRNEKGEFHVISAGIQLGSGAAPWPNAPGLFISGNFDTLDWDQIKKYIGDSGGNQSATANFGGLKLREINIHAKTLRLGGHSLNQISLQVQPSADNWNVNISSSDIAGQLQIPANFNRKGLINAQFQRINLRSGSSVSSSELPTVSVKSLPSISFFANHVSYDGIPLGQVQFRTAPSTNGMFIRSLSIVSGRMNLQAEGGWTQANDKYTTHLRGRVISSRVSELLSSFGFDVRNFIANKGSLNFDLDWGDAPYAPSLSNLNGRAALDLGQGRIVDIGQESGAKMDLGRMLSIFSLQTIPRRLSLDFSDVFQKGYSFDFVRGDFNLQSGDAYTHNLRFDGPVAKVGINGRIGLKNKDYNFVLSVTPYVTSSIPVAAGLITMNPLVGLGALAVNSVIGSQVSKASTYYYSVTGPWSNPTWKSSQSGR